MRLPAVIAALVMSLLIGVVGIALAATPSIASNQTATPEPGPCTVIGTVTMDAWNMPAFDAQIADGSVDESTAECEFASGSDVKLHEHTGWFLLSVQSGSIEFTVHEGIMWTTNEATLLPGTMVPLSAGDWVLQDRATTHSFVAGSGGANVLTAYGINPLNGDGGCRGAC
jgi:hypothetical protein